MTDLDLPELLRLAEAATNGGKWVHIDGYDGARTVAIIRSTNTAATIGLPEDGAPWLDTDANAAYIVAAANSVPVLVRDLMAAREALLAGVRLAFTVNGAVMDEDTVPDDRVDIRLRRDRIAARALIAAVAGIEALAALEGGPK